jgi:hypothetical protein
LRQGKKVTGRSVISINLKTKVTINMAIKIFSFILLSILGFCSMPQKSEKTVGGKAFAVQKDSQKHVTLISVNDFMNFHMTGKNLVHKYHPNDFPAKVEKIKSDSFALTSKFSIDGVRFEYSVFSKTKIEKPYLYLFDKSSYLGSKLIVNGQTFKLDTFVCLIDGYADGLNSKKDLPLRFINMGSNTRFRFNGKKYILMDGYPDCNGRFCDEHYCLFFEIDKENVILNILPSNTYFPFEPDHLFFGDWDKDGNLDYFNVNISKNDTYVVTIFSFKNGKWSYLLNAENTGYYTLYSRHKYELEGVDSLEVIEGNIISRSPQEF